MRFVGVKGEKTVGGWPPMAPVQPPRSPPPPPPPPPPPTLVLGLTTTWQGLQMVLEHGIVMSPRSAKSWDVCPYLMGRCVCFVSLEAREGTFLALPLRLGFGQLVTVTAQLINADQ